MIDKNKEIKQPSGEGLSSEQKIEFSQEGTKYPENQDLKREEIITKEALRREIAKMELEDDLKDEALKKSQEMQTLGEEGKLENLLEIAKSKGVAFAARVANQMNDPFVLDSFHDILVEQWYTYKQFLK